MERYHSTDGRRKPMDYKDRKVVEDIIETVHCRACTESLLPIYCNFEAKKKEAVEKLMKHFDSYTAPEYSDHPMLFGSD